MRCLDTEPTYVEILDTLAVTAKSLLDTSKIVVLFCAVSVLWGVVLYLGLQAA